MSIIEELGGRARFVAIDKVLFLYQERKQACIDECAFVYEIIYYDERFDKEGLCGPQFKGWLRRRRELLRVARQEHYVRFPFLKSKKYAVFVKKLHEAIRRRWQEARKKGLRYPSYCLVRIKREHIGGDGRYG